MLQGFLVGVELVESQITPEQVAAKLADSLAWTEGVGNVDVEQLGEIEIVDEQESNV